MKISRLIATAIILSATAASFMETSVFACSIQPQNNPTRKTKVDVRYDKKGDKSTALLEDVILWKNPDRFEQLAMIVGFDYPKHIISTPKVVSLIFIAATRGWDPFPTDDIGTTVDGVRFEVGKLEPVNRSLNRPADAIDRRHASISYQDFSRLAKAKRASVSIGDRTYDLSDRQLQMLNDFLQLMQQEGQEFK
jgi:hypothetical protein